MWNYAKYFVVPRRKRIVPASLAPVIVMLYTTYRCNLKCPFCSFTRERQPETPHFTATNSDMNLSFVQKILDSDIAKRTLVAVLTGGEPLLNKEIIDMVKFIKSRKKQCAMVSNGTLLRNRIVDLAKAGLDDIQVSVYDATFEKLQSILPDVCSKFPYVNASYVLLKSVLREKPEHVKEVIRLCQESGCRSFKFNICVAPFDGELAKEVIYDDDDAYNNFVNEYRSKFSGDFKIYFPPGAPRSISADSANGCLIPWQQLSVLPNGKITMCCNPHRDNKESSGTIFDGDSDLSYNNEFLQALRGGLLDRGSVCHDACERCVYRTGKAFGARI